MKILKSENGPLVALCGIIAFLIIFSFISVHFGIAPDEKSQPPVTCHACKCQKSPNKCISECNSPKICDIMCARQCQGEKESTGPNRGVVGRSPDLQQEFQDLNAKYFGGSLNNVEIDLSDQRQDDWIGLTTPCGENKYCILINVWLTPAPRERDWVLVHETCHLYVYEKGTPEESHGPEWQACMLNLAEKGAFNQIW